MTQQTQIDITELQVATGPQIQVVLGRGVDAQVVHLTYAELDEFHGGALDVPAMISDENLLTALEGYLREHGHDSVSLADRKITRPATGNLLVGPENIYGGDRANVRVVNGEYEVFLYTHWGGHKLANVVRDALKRGRSRWDDAQYLARIIFCEMIQDDVMGLTGYGIAARVRDGDHNIITVNPGTQTVTTRYGLKQTLEEYVSGAENQPDSG